MQQVVQEGEKKASSTGSALQAMSKVPTLIYRVQHAGSGINSSEQQIIENAIKLANKKPKGLPENPEEKAEALLNHHLDNSSKSVLSFTSDMHQPLRRIGFYKTAEDNKDSQYVIFVRKFDETLVSIESVLAERNVKGFSDAKGEYVLAEAIKKEDLLAAFTPAGFKKFKNGELAQNLLTGKEVRLSDIEAEAVISSDKIDFEERTKDFDPRAFKM